MLPTARTHAASTSRATARRIPAARRALHASARVCAKVKAQRASPAPLRLNSFKELRGPEFLTVLPTPLPVGEQGAAEHQRYFPDSSSMALVAIVDACLSNFHDIPRAQLLFADLRRHRKATSFLDNPNTARQPAEKYRMHAWELYKSMVESKETVEPNSHTSALMLRGLLRTPGLTDDQRQAMAATIIEDSAARNVQLSSIVADPIFATANQAATDGGPSDEATTSKATTGEATTGESIKEATTDEATAAIQLLTRSAFTCLSRTDAVNRVSEMGVQSVGQTDAFLDGIEEVSPVTKRKITVTKTSEDGEIQQEVFEVPFNLDVLRRNLNHFIFDRQMLPDDVLRRQKLLEDSAYDNALERYRHEAEVFKSMKNMGGKLGDRSLQAWAWDWYNLTVPELEKVILETEAAEKRMVNRKNSEDRFVARFLRLLPAKKLVIIAIMELLTEPSHGDSVRTTRAIIQVGKAIELEHHFQTARKEDLPIPNFQQNQVPYYSANAYLDLHKRRMAAKLENEGRENWMPEWTQSIRARVGGTVLDCLMRMAKISRTLTGADGVDLTEEQPAFVNAYRFEAGFKIGVIQLNSYIREKLAKEPVRRALHARHLPMLVPPKPWLGHNNGGYLYSPTSVVRLKETNEQLSYLKEADAAGAIELIYACLDVLSRTPWIINRAVLGVAIAAWNSGKEYPRMPPLFLEQDIPEPPSDLSDMAGRVRYQNRLKALAHQRSSNHSDRCSVNYKMEVARSFLGERFYQPHNVDFRGRAYPIPPHLSHIGDDLCRGLMLFADAKPLGQRGLRWLKIHLANLAGFDKASFDEREKYTMDHLDDIYDSATNPLDGRGWWLKSDDAWQSLATCMELRNALESPDPLMYESRLPIHQDGTCNGLQHYAALGGDVQGARQVNLDVTDRPSDVYTYVAKMVEAELSQAAENGDKFAIMFQGKVSRKVVKQTVMTTVYGVTFVGAREQIARQLRLAEIGDPDVRYESSAYLAQVTLRCIGNLFRGARDIQNWLTTCAKLICRSIPESRIALLVEAEMAKKGRVGEGEFDVAKSNAKEHMTAVIWTSLLGLPIVQPYRKQHKKQLVTRIQSVFLSDPNKPGEVNAVKQASAFPPNFVHSLDATHMMLTALECDRRGITFASVHDSYWTHASTIDEMSTIIRESFVHLHSSNVLQNLYEEFRQRYAGYRVPITHLVRMKRQVNMPPEVKEILEAYQRKIRSKLINYGDESEAVAGEGEDAESSESDVVTAEDIPKKRGRPRKVVGEDTPKKRGRPLKAGATKTKVRRKVAVEADAEDAAENRSKRFLTEIERQAGGDKEKMRELLTKHFVPLIDILPPLPMKGDFDIELIKQSPYFFS